MSLLYFVAKGIKSIPSFHPVPENIIEDVIGIIAGRTGGTCTHVVDEDRTVRRPAILALVVRLHPRPLLCFMKHVADYTKNADIVRIEHRPGQFRSGNDFLIYGPEGTNWEGLGSLI